MANPGALANLDIDATLDRIAGGEIMRNIAAEYGVRKESLRERLIKSPRYKDCIAQQADSLVQSVIEEHWEMPAELPIIARARAKADVAFKYAKAHNPAYADKVDAMGVQIVVNIAPTDQVLVAQTPTAQRTIGQPVRIADDST